MLVGSKVGGYSSNSYTLCYLFISDEDDVAAPTPGYDTLRRKKTTLYSLVTSVQLMLGHSLQQELGEAETQEAELEEVGREMEGTLRKKRNSEYRVGVGWGSLPTGV